MLEERILTVSQYLHLINETLALIPSEQTFVVGEISDYRVSQGKWINFSLKDEEVEAKISCFATTFKIHTPLADGMKVQVIGSPKVYERFGKFSLNVESIELVGEGALAKAYKMLKKKLEEEGLFDVGRKRKLPRFPKRIGLITSREAAAYGDFIRILNNRWSGVEVVHIPVHVQGKNAVPEILQAFSDFNDVLESERPDVLVLTRGGGALEDLHAFNDELVARAVFQSSIPVVVGVGHERDESLCDFAADVRASTPSNAAEIVVPDRSEVLLEINTSTVRMGDILQMGIERRNRSVERAVGILDRFIELHVQSLRMTIERFSHAFERFRLSLFATRQYIENNSQKIVVRFENVVAITKQSSSSLIRLLKSFDFERVLERGYSIVRSEKGVVRDVSAIAVGDRIQIQLARGGMSAKITDTEK